MHRPANFSLFPSFPLSLCRSALPLVLERFADEPGVAVELARAALAMAAGGSGKAGAGADGACNAGEGAAAARAEAEALVLELVGDERLAERLEEAGLRQARPRRGRWVASGRPVSFRVLRRCCCCSGARQDVP